MNRQFFRIGVNKMPWNMNDYPASLKNFDHVLRKKIIDIANALLANGYEDSQAIPIAISQGKEWYNNVSLQEKKAFERQPDPSKNDSHEQNSNPDLLDENVEVFFENKEWHVKTVKAKRARDTFDTKEEAVDRAKEIAENKNTKVISFTKDGKKQT